MRIALAARWLSLEPGGAREYTKHLIEHLIRLDDRNDYVVFYNSHRFKETFPNAEEIVIPVPSRFLWDHVGLPFFTRRQHIDLLWVPSYVIPHQVNCRAVASVLDLAYFLRPESYRLHDVLYMQKTIPGSLKRADAVLAISENTKQDIVRLFPGSETKTFVTHLAPGPGYVSVSDEPRLASVRAEYDLPPHFILYPGSISPRKGIALLLSALAQLHGEHQLPHSLVITGGRAWGRQDFDSLTSHMPEGKVRILGHVPEAHLPAIYSLADLCVYPSLFEGFGLPVLEAMACGCPVVCSNRTSLPEVAGDAAILVDPSDISSLARAMHTALTDTETRKLLIKKGFARAACFTWEKTARRTLEAFEWAVQHGRDG